MVSEVSLFLQRIIPGGHPIGNNCFFCSDLRTFRASFFYPYCSINLQLNPPYPLKQKREQIERVLKGKLFINTIQPSNSPTMKNILKCNSLLYSSIYIVFNYIYILYNRCLVGRCWTCWIDDFQPSIQQSPSNKNSQKGHLLDVLDTIQQYFLLGKFA